MINTITLSGNVGKDIALQKTKNGKSVVRFSLAGSAGRKENDNYKTEWIICEAWNSLADRLANTPKGTSITVQGRICTDAWQDGSVTKTRTFINVTGVEMPKASKQTVFNVDENGNLVEPVEESKSKAPTRASDNLWTASNNDFPITNDDLPF